MFGVKGAEVLHPELPGRRHFPRERRQPDSGGFGQALFPPQNDRRRRFQPPRQHPHGGNGELSG